MIIKLHLILSITSTNDDEDAHVLNSSRRNKKRVSLRSKSLVPYNRIQKNNRDQRVNDKDTTSSVNTRFSLQNIAEIDTCSTPNEFIIDTNANARAKLNNLMSQQNNHHSVDDNFIEEENEDNKLMCLTCF